jgi:uncharacterized membrane protein YqaE (UPF0057 family)
LPQPSQVIHVIEDIGNSWISASPVSAATAGGWVGWLKEVLMDLLRVIAAILLPPLGVFLQVGIGKHFWINILLTLLGYIPGIVHAIWVIAKY